VGRAIRRSILQPTITIAALFAPLPETDVILPPHITMHLTTGTRLGPYEIVAPLGAGGMGEVYRAHDSRLGREVAVKVLPASFASNPERLRRFEQEARATSALSHPNILGVYDIGSHEAAPYVSGDWPEIAARRQATLPTVRRRRTARVIGRRER
jgi:serine/threonine protein kinase